MEALILTEAAALKLFVQEKEWITSNYIATDCTSHYTQWSN